MTVYDEWTRASGEVVVGLTTGSIDTTTEDIAGELRPIGVPLDDDDKEFRVLHPLSVDSAAGSLTVGGWAAEGTKLTQQGRPTSLVNNICEVSSALVKSDAQKRLGVDASGAVEECLGAFMIFCGGLVKALQDDMEEDGSSRTPAASARPSACAAPSASRGRGDTATHGRRAPLLEQARAANTDCTGLVARSSFSRHAMQSRFICTARAPAPLRLPPLLGGSPRRQRCGPRLPMSDASSSLGRSSMLSRSSGSMADDTGSAFTARRLFAASSAHKG